MTSKAPSKAESDPECAKIAAAFRLFIKSPELPLTSEAVMALSGSDFETVSVRGKDLHNAVKENASQASKQFATKTADFNYQIATARLQRSISGVVKTDQAAVIVTGIGTLKNSFGEYMVNNCT